MEKNTESHSEKPYLPHSGLGMASAVISAVVLLLFMPWMFVAATIHAFGHGVHVIVQDAVLACIVIGSLAGVGL